MLYGTDDNGGANGQGTVFRYDLSTGKFRTLYEFSGGTKDGNDPAVAPVFSHGYLYVLSSTALLKLRASNGEVVWDSSFTSDQGGFGTVLALRRGVLYGVNQSYGANNDGTIFSADPATGAVSLVYTFSVPGAGSALFHGTTLYGTYPGVQQDDGVFSYAVASGTFSELYDFPAYTGPVNLAVAVERMAYVAAGTTNGDNETCSLYRFPF